MILKCVIIFICFGFGHSLLIRQERLESFQPCKVDEDCKPNSFCFNNDIDKRGNCKCRDDYYLWRNGTAYGCFLPANYGESCETDLQCQATLNSKGICNANMQCSCAEDAHYYDGKCYITSKIGDKCSDDNVCRAIDKINTFCTDGFCTCRYMYQTNERGICVKVSHLGELCDSDESCIAMDARCLSGTCECRSGYVQANNNHKCLIAATKFEEPCEQLSQCNKYLEGSKCMNTRCLCSPGNHAVGNRCYRSAQIGEICNNDKECQLSPSYTDNVKCDKNVCVSSDRTLSSRGGCDKRRASLLQLAVIGVCAHILKIL